jgi:hypothetical protein
MAIAIPTLPAGSSTTISLKSSAVDQAPYNGGRVQRVARLGDRWSYSVDLRPMYSLQSQPLIAILLQGLSATVLCPVIVAGVDLRGQTDVTAASGAGKSIVVSGSMAKKTVGQFFSLVSGGVRYLHQITAINGQTISFLPTLKVKVSGGEVLEFAQPKIEGFLEGSEQSWAVGLVGNVGLSFKINEAQ